MKSLKKVKLIIIDPENDFADESGSLYVGTAKKDAQNLATFINKDGDKLEDIDVTLDQHHVIDVGHPPFWPGVTPIAQLTYDKIKGAFIDVITGKTYEPFCPSLVVREVTGSDGKVKKVTLREDMIDYSTKLTESNKNGKYDTSLTVWFEHCLMGSWGACIVDPVFRALTDWERRGPAQVNKFLKGTNYLREHYSVIKAQVEDPSDPTTLINTRFVQSHNDVDEIIITGWALNYCLANTFFDFVEIAGDDVVKKFVLFEDCTSSVRHPIPEVDAIMKGYEDSFMNEMIGKGMRVTTSEQYKFE